MIHAAITAIFCGLLFLLPSTVFNILCFLPAAFYVGREFTQAEYRYINNICIVHKRENMPWWGGFYYKVWNVKSFLDFFLPCVVSVVMFVLYRVLVL